MWLDIVDFIQIPRNKSKKKLNCFVDQFMSY